MKNNSIIFFACGMICSFFLFAIISQNNQKENFDEVYSAVDSLSQVAYKKTWHKNLDSAIFYYNQFEVYHNVKQKMLDTRIKQLKWF